MLQDKFRSLVKVSRPKRFEELRDIIIQLEEDCPAKIRPVAEEDTHRKCFRCETEGHFKKKCPIAGVVFPQKSVPICRGIRAVSYTHLDVYKRQL